MATTSRHALRRRTVTRACIEYRVPGVAVVTSGPGVTNSMTPLASAYHDSVPLILLAGQVKSADLNPFGVRSYGAQEVPSLDLVRPLVKDALRYVPSLVSDQRLADFFSNALHGRKGPVFVEIPLDIQPTAVDGAEKRLDDLMSAISTTRKPQHLVHSGASTFHISSLPAVRPSGCISWKWKPNRRSRPKAIG